MGLTKLNRIWIDHNIKLQSKIAKKVLRFMGACKGVGVWSEVITTRTEERGYG